MAVIKTPDQRLRVFISSTINELAEERKSAREAISNLRLIPVFFEAGARPHPPRDLYSAYLEQSHIFVGIYWNSYGWVAPGAEISGLEDEYRLCGIKKPKLIYVKQSDHREEKLNGLLQDIQDSETACYQKFSDAAELKQLLENDLSVLMSEIFETALAEKSVPAETAAVIASSVQKPRIELPVLRMQMIGREHDMAELRGLLNAKDTSLVTILGAGGTGKTTLSIHLAHAVSDNYADGAVFVQLAAVSDHKLVVPTIADAFDLQDAGKQSVLETLQGYLMDKHLLLLLDNFEQVHAAASELAILLEHCPKLKILVTSRTPLRLRAEKIYPLSPLELPELTGHRPPEDLQTNPAVMLFMQRAREVNPQVPSDEANIHAVAEICMRLDGLPLAIELAASRTRMFQPSALVKRMDKLLDTTGKGSRDLPERQQTLRNAIEWSYNLLDANEKKVFCILGIFKRSFTIESADAMINNPEDPYIDVESSFERLMDVSLVKPVLDSGHAEPRFIMLQTVHEYAAELLQKEPYFLKLQKSYIQYFCDSLEATRDKLFLGISPPLLDRIDEDFQNIRSAFHASLSLGGYADAWKMIELLVPFWTVRGGYSEGMDWLQKAGVFESDEQLSAWGISDLQVGRTSFWAGLVMIYLLHLEEGYRMLHRAEQFSEKTGDKNTLAMALVVDGGYGTFMQLPDAVEKFTRGYTLAHECKNDLALIGYYTWTCDYFRAIGDLDKVAENLVKGKEVAQRTASPLYMFWLVLTEHSENFFGSPEQIIAMYRSAMELLSSLPERGMRGVYSACYGAVVQYLTVTDPENYAQINEYKRLMVNAARESGEKESEFHVCLEAVYFFQMYDETEASGIMIGAVDAFIAETGYPMMGSVKAKYDGIVKAVREKIPADRLAQYMQTGSRLSLPEAVLVALKDIGPAKG